MKKQQLYSLALRDKDMLPVLAYGTAGTGKTYGACEAAVEYYRKDKRNKLVVIRPNVGFADEIGFLPGTEREKMEPWIRPVAQHFNSFDFSYNEQDCAEKSNRLIYLPLNHIQGLTFDNSFIILDECENMSFAQLKGFLTRIGKWSKVVMCGDVNQVSPMFKNSGLKEFIAMVDHFDLPVHTIGFTRDDVLRGKTCKQFIIAFEDWEDLKDKLKDKS